MTRRRHTVLGAALVAAAGATVLWGAHKIWKMPLPPETIYKKVECAQGTECVQPLKEKCRAADGKLDPLSSAFDPGCGWNESGKVTGCGDGECVPKRRMTRRTYEKDESGTVRPKAVTVVDKESANPRSENYCEADCKR